MPRAVLDTSVLVSAFLTPRGSVVRLLREPARSQHQLCLSEYILTETAETLLSKTRLRNYAYADMDVRDFIHWQLTHGDVGAPQLVRAGGLDVAVHQIGCGSGLFVGLRRARAAAVQRRARPATRISRARRLRPCRSAAARSPAGTRGAP